jgi:hypothetical protein
MDRSPSAKTLRRRFLRHLEFFESFLGTSWASTVERTLELRHDTLTDCKCGRIQITEELNSQLNAYHSSLYSSAR